MTNVMIFNGAYNEIFQLKATKTSLNLELYDIKIAHPSTLSEGFGLKQR